MGLSCKEKAFGCVHCESWGFRRSTNKEIFLIDYHWDEELQMDDLVLIFDPHDVLIGKRDSSL
jgi:hypothetical protein